MPAPALQSLADKAGVSMDRAEELWKKAEGIVKKEYPKVKDDRFYALVMGILKKMLKLDEESMASITTTTAGNVSSLGGGGNFAKYFGYTSRPLDPYKKKKKKKKKSESFWEWLENDEV